ncbi:unnamed protein product [Mytilus edulis]|uniref:Reverse transcriptase domain-containing protein n=1 Tax=Mytilus edulis TaxID=6550 RepID=A0A8S3SG28_MYTED|nr:unnamed protein product [Mytilus edulis]
MKVNSLGVALRTATEVRNKSVYTTHRCEVFKTGEDQQPSSAVESVIHLMRDTTSFRGIHGGLETESFHTRKNKDLDLYINHLSNFPLIPKPQDKVKNNLPFKQQQALYRLQKDESIIIKEADKGGALVIMDRIYYRDKIQEQLNDKQYYRELNDNMEKKTKRNINKLISKFPHCTTEKEVDYLTKFEVKTSNFYGLPKIHKSKEVETAVQQQNCAYIEINSPKDLKFRPIVAGPQCPTHRLSHFIDLILKPLCQYVPSFIRDNFDFLNHLPAEVKEDAILVSFDVTSLYTNIPHKLGLDAVKFWLESYRHIIDQRFSNNFLLEGLKIILDNNTFFFDGKYYLQISGTAMGTKVAPTYATLVMGFLEDKMYQQVETPATVNNLQLETDVEAFARRLRLKEHFNRQQKKNLKEAGMNESDYESDEGDICIPKI